MTQRGAGIFVLAALAGGVLIWVVSWQQDASDSWTGLAERIDSAMASSDPSGPQRQSPLSEMPAGSWRRLPSESLSAEDSRDGSPRPLESAVASTGNLHESAPLGSVDSNLAAPGVASKLPLGAVSGHAGGGDPLTLSQLPAACLTMPPEADVSLQEEMSAVQALVDRYGDEVVPDLPHSPPASRIAPRAITSLPAVGAPSTVDWAASESTVRPVGFENPAAVGSESHPAGGAALYNPHARASAAGTDVSHQQSHQPSGQDPQQYRLDNLLEADCVDPHADVFSDSLFPSAVECAKCHEQIFEEWASSSHAYAAVSPMFHRFEDKINSLAQGTLGYFCLRCHAPVATTQGLRRDQPIWDGPRVFREGVTCVACHRVAESYVKAHGERRIEPGTIYDPVYSGSGQIGSQIAGKYKDFFKVKTSPDDQGPGQPIHSRAIQFEQLSQSDFCMSCHQVAVQPGIKLEVVWDQYRASPAYRDGTTCQDCHMGIVPGRADGYSIGPAAVVDGKAVTPERKHSNHVFYGPGYSIAHPGVFPQNPDADRWSFNDWLMFDWRAGWGTEELEQAVADGRVQPWFPEAWAEPDDRYDAREIIDANLKKLTHKKDLRRQVLENGSKIDGPFFQNDPIAGEALRFHYCVTNTNPGHNMPSGSLGAQPQLWLNVVLIGPTGERLWESGYLDSQGDLADLHSDDVLNRRIPLDKQLFNLQTKFLTTNVKGTDREMYLPINIDFDQLPFIRPTPQPVTVINHPPFIRMEGHSIPPLGSRKAKYVIPAALMQQPGTYRLSVRMRSRAEPIYFMKFVEATPEMIRMMNEWIADAHVQSVVFEVQ